MAARVGPFTKDSLVTKGKGSEFPENQKRTKERIKDFPETWQRIKERVFSLVRIWKRIFWHNLFFVWNDLNVFIPIFVLFKP